MAMGSRSVRGTPVNFIPAGSTANEGIRPGVPKGFQGGAGTVAPSYEHQNQQPGHGTPYQSGAGNSDEFKRTVSEGRKGGIVLSENGINHNDPRANGTGVVLDGLSRAEQYSMKGPRTMDSPVPEGAPVFEPSAMLAENKAHLGSGNERASGDVLQEIGGVMSRGMDTTSQPGNPETELIEDDLLRNLGAGGAVG